MKACILNILIPTFNRAKDLGKNLNILAKQILATDLEQKISISISDNCSEDHTNQVVTKFIDQYPTITISYTRNSINIGLEPNVVQLLKNATAPYILWLGDDDYLADGYLNFVCEKISKDGTGVIISGLGALKENGEVTLQRDQSTPVIETKAGFESMLAHSHMAHQMSGLMVKRSGLYEKYIKNDKWRNPYLFVFMAANCLLKHNGVYAPKFVTQVSDFNSKDWGYNRVGLLDQVFKSYYHFLSELGEEQVRQLLVRFSTLHSYRYSINKWRPRRLIRQYQALVRTVPTIPKFKRTLAAQLLKDYLLSWKG